MGLQIIIKGVDYSSLGLGQIVNANQFINAAGITDNTTKSAINTLLSGMIDKGLWDKMIAIYPFAGSTAQSQKFNLKDPRDENSAFRLNFVSGTHSSAGFVTNGSSTYADTFFVPKSIQNFHCSFYNTAPQVNTGVPMGCISNGDSQLYLSRNWAQTTHFQSGTMASAPSNYDKSKKGLLVGTRQSIYQSTLYDSGVSITVNNESAINSENSFNANTNKFLIGGCTDSQGVPSFFGNITLGFASIGSHLTSQNVIDLNSLVVEYETALGR